MIIGFTNRQLRLVMRGAELISLPQRDSYLRSVAGRLTGYPYAIRDIDVEEAIRFVLETRGICYGKSLFAA
jgi:hypothetical protein